ncbi:MAG TPA: serine/threonine-protein phosphatase [Ottowia sp.]|jgi:serine/threonine protein phosphatase PrpC|nr:serine/threonine-protein phosphatase [Ottowia sp.]OJV56647.1 MAG: serine/threonine protein phosphatase [Burkholderiales bacterium 68-10]HMT17376.1 serine/threonine-protein phosphatase [Ottowia sp.]HMT57467.1 serine/threonine-protein phosphatase [Ottowia sp.]HMT65830.1 serine/threonine-protein phosphatase [Ottowia sp.]
MKFSVFQLSRRGGREKNEDRMGYSYTRDAGLFALADGMGGHPDGEVAAQIALQTLSALFQREARPRLAAPASFLAASLMGAHHQIIRYASERGLLDTPRTTLVAALAQGGELHWMHCGDSRLYVVRDGQLLLRTRDHSYSEAQANAGMATEGINRNVLFTCLGSTVRPMFDVAGPLRLLEGDRVLLCSDGLWGSLADELIVSTLGTLPVAKAVPTLVDAALQAAGEHSDNVTVLAIEWESPADAAFEHSGFTETQVLSDEVFASTIQAGAYDPLLDDLDDEAIERSIAEINAAIQRTAMNRR